MQNRYAGDIGDYVKLSLLRTLSPGKRLGVAWYLFPDENHNSDGRHIAYLSDSERWRHLDPGLFDGLRTLITGQRSVAELTSHLNGGVACASAVVPGASLPASVRSDARADWFNRVQEELADCDLVFADPDNGLVDDLEHRRRQMSFGKRLPLAEARAISEGRTAVIYHHNSRFKGGHDAEVNHWLRELGSNTIAVRAAAYSCRTFFILNPDGAIRDRAEEFCRRWSDHKVWLHRDSP